MNEQEFAQQVQALEQYALEHPEAYKIRAALLACLGYGFLLLLLGFIGALLIGLIALMSSGGSVVFVKLLIPILLFAAVILQAIFRALWIKIPAPEGYEIHPHQAPELFQFLRETRAKLRSPRLHHVLITDDFNAAIVQVPRLGALGWSANYLVIGLPLMQALTTEQFESVLAHEMGHLSRSHGWVSVWILRFRYTWATLMEQLEAQETVGSSIIESFIQWYAPYFNAYTFVLARMREYEADQAAATLVGVRATAEALIETEIKSQYLEQSYWRNILRKASQQPSPPTGIYAEIPMAFRQPLPSDLITSTLKNTLAIKTGYDDTHPALNDRLAALGFTPPKLSNQTHWSDDYQLSSLKESAAQVLLGTAYQLTVSHFEDEWKQKIGSDWEERYQYVQKSSQILAEFDARREQNLEFDESDLWKYAALTAEFQETEKALPLLAQLLEQNPQHAGANFLYGQCLLQNGDAAGIPYIERAIEQDFQNSEPGYQTLLQFCLDHELKDEFEKHKLQLIRFYDRMELARRERQSVTEYQLKSHRMPPEVVRRLSDQLAAFPQVKIAYLAEKDVQVFPEIPYLVLGIVPNFSWLTYDTDKAMNQLLQELINNMKFPYETYVIVLGKTSENFKMRFEAISNAHIYSKVE